MTRYRTYTRPGKIHVATNDFECRACGDFVSANATLSGVSNRNHCPYCLSSRHLDQFEAGDRLSACKARMQPVGLTFKQRAKKYAGHQPGELMLIHQCDDCGKLSINRIAADDDSQMILALLDVHLPDDLRDNLAQHGITPLTMVHFDQVRRCLYGM